MERSELHVSNCDSPPVKRNKGHFSLSDKQTILNIFNTYKDNNPSENKTECVKFVARAFGASVSGVYKILKEVKDSGSLSSPKEICGRKSLDYSEEVKTSVRRIIHSFFAKNEIPTLDKILSKINEDIDLPNIKRSSLYKLVKELNFRFEGRKRNSFLKERNDILTWRSEYLREIRKKRNDNQKIYYLDETWINAGHTVNKVWVDKEITNPRAAHLEGLSTGLKHPSGKGGRFIILHIGSEDGFVDEGLLMFESKQVGDYHRDMNAKVFEDWFEKILSRLDKKACIVMDNASYHSRRLNKCPTAADKKAVIQEWLTMNNVGFDKEMSKAVLLTLVKSNQTVQKYIVDEMATLTERTVLRLPPYHCELNPIELIWAQIKGEVARNNSSFKMKDVKVLFMEAVQHVTKENWTRAIEHVKKEENKMRELVGIMNDMEPVIINIGESDSDDSIDSNF